jgi:hypothetical protein
MDNPVEVLVNEAPDWVRTLERNLDGTFPDRHFGRSTSTEMMLSWYVDCVSRISYAFNC